MSDINQKQITFYLIGTFAIIIGIIIWFTKTDYYMKKDYLKFKKMEFKTVIVKKIDEHPVRGNKIDLKKGGELIVGREIFDKLKISDSVKKMINSDSIYFYTSSGLIINDYNKFKREKYLNSKD